MTVAGRSLRQLRACSGGLRLRPRRLWILLASEYGDVSLRAGCGGRVCRAMLAKERYADGFDYPRGLFWSGEMLRESCNDILAERRATTKRQADNRQLSSTLMRILVHDYSGHPFQVELSRALASRGHNVSHLYNGYELATPKGAVARRNDDPSAFRITALELPRAVSKTRFYERWRLERLYGRILASYIRRYPPDVVLLANTPLEATSAAQTVCRSLGIPMVYWLQDLIGEAAERVLMARLGILGRLVGRYYRRMEKRLLQRSNWVVGITDDFRRVVESAGVPMDCYTTIPNWAPLGDLEPRPYSNDWARENGLEDRFVFLYSGSLGFKHNPRLLLSLAQEFADDSDVSIVVNSQGDAADWLRAAGRHADLKELIVNPFQPYEVMPDVLGSATVLVSVLEPDAGIYSVPSKVLTYHCAGRPLLLAVPRENLAARIVLEEGSGLVVDPRDEAAFISAARRLYEDHEQRVAMSRRARGYAERCFNIESITDRFERILSDVGREAGHD